MTIAEAIANALALLEAEGYKGGDIHDDLALVFSRLRTKYRHIGDEEL
jgi:hypothetical protein